jgi:voltage-gated potassium channel
VLFAGTYVAMAAHSAGNFGEHLTHTDALYFTVTVFSAVGFGDITAKTEAARLVVTGQMITDLVVVGVGIILGAVTRGSSGDASSAKTLAAYRRLRRRAGRSPWPSAPRRGAMRRPACGRST